MDTAVFSGFHDAHRRPGVHLVEYKYELAKKLTTIRSHFNTKIDGDPTRLAHVYNELLFKMDTLPEFLKPIVLNLVGFIECTLGRGRSIRSNVGCGQWPRVVVRPLEYLLFYKELLLSLGQSESHFRPSVNAISAAVKRSEISMIIN
eukprot:sb/3473793/